MKRDRLRHGYVPGMAALFLCLAVGVTSAAPPQEKGKAAKPRVASRGGEAVRRADAAVHARDLPLLRVPQGDEAEPDAAGVEG